MTLDTQARNLLDAVKALGAPEMWQLTPDVARVEYLRRTAKAKADVDIFKVEDRQIPGPLGPIGIRIYSPRSAQTGELLPVLVWYHGGGFVIGDLDSHDSACRALSNQAECIVVAVDYRLAPEHKFPAAVVDCEAALIWVAAHATEFGGDKDRLAVGGDSAGGNLAAAVALLARDNRGPYVCFQLLIYPCVAAEPETRSHHQFAEGYLLTRKTLTWFYKQYLRTSKDTRDPRYAPLEADDLSSLPPALVIVAGYDPLRDEGVDFARALIEAGNQVRLSNYEGMIHGFYLMGGVIDQAAKAIEESALQLKIAFQKS
ncbi:MAG: alpha/beta hydrolase [Proteobacteria bacterium]|jgi:acetyl esterase|nr:alpha/beta hydrolase [Pseudomonadota bacterium]